MICPRCGYEMKEEHLYCERCGAEIQIVPDFEPEIQNSIEETLSTVAWEINPDLSENSSDLKKKPQEEDFLKEGNVFRGITSRKRILITTLTSILMTLVIILLAGLVYQNLKGLAMNIEPVFQIGKSGLTPEVTEAVRESFNRKELVKLAVLKNCMEDPNAMAQILAERTGSQVVQVIGKKIVLYKENKDHKKIELPR